MRTDLGPTVVVDLRSVTSAVIDAIERDSGEPAGVPVWDNDGDTPVRANGYTPHGAVHVLRARDGSLWRLTVEPADTADPSDVVAPLRALLHDRPRGWYVGDGLSVISGPFDQQQAAEAERRRVAAARTDPRYKYPDGAPMPIWTPTTYYWPGDAAA